MSKVAEQYKSMQHIWVGSILNQNDLQKMGIFFWIKNTSRISQECLLL